MEEEIDLRPYIESILNRWPWIVGAGIVSAMLAFIVSSFIPPKYEATALIAIVQSNDVIEFDPRFREAAENKPLNAFPELATSDAILTLVLNDINIPEIKNIQQLGTKLSVDQGSDRSLLRLSATDQDPAIASHLANNWASKFVPWANAIYSDQDAEDAIFFEEQLIVAQENLEIAEEAFIAYQGINPSETISNTLNIYGFTQKAYLQEEQDLIVLRQDAEALRTQILAIDNQTNYDISELTALTLQLRTFHAEKALPILLNLSNTSDLESLSPADQIAFLDAIIEVIENRSTQVEMELEQLSPQIQQLQQQFQEADTEYVRLLRDLQIAEETYLALAIKVQEIRITVEDTSQSIRLASGATVPSKDVSSQKLVIISVATFLGLASSIFTLMLKTWWNLNPIEVDE